MLCKTISIAPSPLCRVAILPLLWLLSSLAFAGNCIPNVHLLAESPVNRLIADVTVIGNAPSPYPNFYDSAIVEVSTVYAGSAPRRIVIESGAFEVASIDCPFNVSGVPVGTRLFINVTQDPVTGRFGGGFRDNLVYADGDTVRGLLFVDDCAPDDQNCLYSSREMNTADFVALAESYYPDSTSTNFSAKFFGFDVALSDGMITPGAEIAIAFEKSFDCSDLLPNAVRTSVTQGLLELSLTRTGPLTDIIPQPFCSPTTPRKIPVGRVYETGSYTLRLYSGAGAAPDGYFDEDNFISEIPFEVTEPSELAKAETPAQGSVQSGVGLIRGWACDASSVVVQFDDLPPFQLAYGTSRLDTLSVCGDANNGYGAAFAWGSLGEGAHTMSTWIDGRLISTVEFEVSGLGSPFITGLSGEYEVADFPEAGEGVLLRWSQADQNFIIVERSE